MNTDPDTSYSSSNSNEILRGNKNQKAKRRRRNNKVFQDSWLNNDSYKGWLQKCEDLTKCK